MSMYTYRYPYRYRYLMHLLSTHLTVVLISVAAAAVITAQLQVLRQPSLLLLHSAHASNINKYRKYKLLLLLLPSSRYCVNPPPSPHLCACVKSYLIFSFIHF
jgi:hypothetical protein